MNEDSVNVAECAGAQMFILADGLGGHGRGDQASRLVVDKMTEVFERSCVSLDGSEPISVDAHSEAVSVPVPVGALHEADEGNLLAEGFAISQEALTQEQRRLGLDNEMKSTLVCLHIDGDTAQWGHVGDSRLYWFRKNKLIARTLDHSVPQMLVASGEIKEKHIRFHEDRNRLIRVMGMEWNAPKYELSERCEIRREDSFLLCSDGFWEYIDEKDMAKLRKKADNSAEKWLLSMEEVVLKNGRGHNMDNYSVIGVRV